MKDGREGRRQDRGLSPLRKSLAMDSWANRPSRRLNWRLWAEEEIDSSRLREAAVPQSRALFHHRLGSPQPRTSKRVVLGEFPLPPSNSAIRVMRQVKPGSPGCRQSAVCARRHLTDSGSRLSAATPAACPHEALEPPKTPSFPYKRG